MQGCDEDGSPPGFPPIPRRGRGGFRAGARGSTKQADEAIRQTDSDALLARASAAALGYFSDPFTRLFASVPSPPRRPPLINVGTHHRTFALDILVEQFLSAPFSSRTKRNVVSLGAGSDSRFWRLRAKYEAEGKEWPVGRWVETDFPETTASKALRILDQPELRNRCGGDIHLTTSGSTGAEESNAAKTGLTASLYTLLPVDLRASDPSTSLVTLLKPYLSSSAPTLVIGELVFAYMEPSHSAALLSALVGEFSKSENSGGVLCISYEMLGLGDNFGRVMVANLRARKLTLAGLPANSSVESQAVRFAEAGCAVTGARNLKDIRRRVIPTAERSRIAKLEMLDEVEELELVLEHYCIGWGWHPGMGKAEAWRGIGLNDAN